MHRDAAALIADALRTNKLVHPGNPDTGQPPVALPLPFKTVGMPPPLAEQLNATVGLMAEAITELIETKYAIIDTAELAALRTTAQQVDAQPGRHVTVHCRCDTTRRTPLLSLPITGDTAVIDGRQLLSGLARRSPDCPHEIRYDSPVRAEVAR